MAQSQRAWNGLCYHCGFLICGLIIVMPELTAPVISLLVAVAFCAGLVSSMAGAGGLITLPALLWAGLPPLVALGSNKVQSALGTLVSTAKFVRSGHLELRVARTGLLMAGGGAVLGTWVVQRLSNAVLEPLLPVVMIAIALYFLVSPRIGDDDAPRRVSPRVFDYAGAPVMGFYGGFFGPGMGSIFPFLLVSLRGYNLRKATAHTKALVLTVNGTSALLFTAAGQVVWKLALTMAVAQMAGAWFGAGLVIRRGTRLVQPVIVVITVAVALRLLWAR